MFQWLRNLLTRFAAFTIDGLHPRDPALARILGLGGMRTYSGITVDEEKSLGYPSLWRGVNILSNGVAKLPLDVYRSTADGKTRDEGHPAQLLLRRKPNQFRTAFSFRKALMQHALLWGNGMAYIIRDGAGRPLELIPLLPDRTSLAIERNPGNPAERRLTYTTIIQGRPFFMLAENVFHIRGLSFDGLWGWPVVELLKETIGLGMAAREFGGRFFGQGMAAAGVVMIPHALDEEAEANLRRSMNLQTEQMSAKHRILLLEEGAKFEKLTIPPEQAQFLQTRQFEIREIANVLGIQPHKLGDNTRTSYASLEQSNQEHLDDDLDPWLVAWEEEAWDKLLSEVEKADGTRFVEFNRRALLRADLAARSQHYASGRQWGYYSANDIRRFENLDTIGEKGDIYLQPANMTEAGEPPPPVTPAIPAPNAPPTEPVPKGENRIAALSEPTANGKGSHASLA